MACKPRARLILPLQGSLPEKGAKQGSLASSAGVCTNGSCPGSWAQHAVWKAHGARRLLSCSGPTRPSVLAPQPWVVWLLVS